jgi:hypothetical protein
MAFWIGVVLALLVGLLVLAILSRIRVRIRYSRSGQLDQAVLIVRAIYGIVRYKLEIPSIMIRGWNVIYRQKTSGNVPGQPTSTEVERPLTGSRKSKGSTASNAASKLLRQMPKGALRAWVLETLRKVDCTRFRLDFRVGTGDAPSTAVVSGLLWSVYGCAVAVTGETMKLKARPQGNVQPVYDSSEFAMVWEADFRIRLGAALWSVLKLGLRAIPMGRSIGHWRRALAGS